MIKAKIKCVCSACGKEFEYAKAFANKQGADKYREYISKIDMMCGVCKTEAIRKEDEAYQFPELVGSQRQVDWAVVIRHDQLRKTGEFIEKEDEKVRERNILGMDETIRTMMRCRNLLAEQTSAKWWIDHRGDSAETLLINIYRRYADEISCE